MMENEFDSILKQRLQRYESDVPADIWQRIASDKKKRRIGFLWFEYFTALLLLLFAICFFIFYSGSHKMAG